MILFTAGGSLSMEFKSQFPCEIISARAMTDQHLVNCIKDASVLIHNAANLTCNTFHEAINDNFLLTKRILDLAHKAKPEIKFLYISSMSILETENTYKEIEKMNLYSFSKYLAEIYCLKHDHHDVSSVRFSTIFYGDPGKDGLSKLICDAINYKEITLYNNGKAKRDFMPLSIAAKYLYKLTASKKIHKKINIASGLEVSFKEMSDYLSRSVIFKVINKNIKIPNKVLSAFSLKDIEDIGLINFTLEREIDKYVAKLTA